MPKWLTLIEAVARVELRTRLSNSQEVLESAIDDGELVVQTIAAPSTAENFAAVPAFRDAISVYAGGATQLDIEPAGSVRVSADSLNDWLRELLGETSSQAVAPEKAKAGAKPTYDWDEYERVFAQKVAEIGAPDLQNEKGWRTKADVRRFLLDLAAKDNSFPSETQARDMANKFLKRIERE